MSGSKIFAVATVFIFIFGAATMDFAVAGEKMKWHGTGIGVKWEQLEVGDLEGHVIGLFESKQIYLNETTGEKNVSVSIGLMDMNPKMMQASGHGYGVSIGKDGSKVFRSWEGKAVGKGHWHGTWTVIGGTDKNKGATGGGTWDSFSLAPQHEWLEVEGEINIPGQ